MANNQYPRRRRESKRVPYGITSKPFNSRTDRAHKRGEDLVIFVPDDLVPMKEVKDNE